MKKAFLFTLSVAAGIATLAQQPAKTKPVAKPSKPAIPATSLKTVNDSASYAIGVSVASFYKQQGITSINTAILSRAIGDVMSGKKALLDDMTCNTVVTKLINTAQEEKSKPTIEEGQAFLEKNKTRPGVKTTASGLQYEVVSEGTGAKPSAADSVTVNYKGTLINGSEFDNSYTRGEPITFSLNRVIAGWTEGLQLMSVGSKYKFYIPYTLAYGSNDYGPIPGGSTLLFEIDLLDVKKSQ